MSYNPLSWFIQYFIFGPVSSRVLIINKDIVPFLVSNFPWVWIQHNSNQEELTKHTIQYFIYQWEWAWYYCLWSWRVIFYCIHIYYLFHSHCAILFQQGDTLLISDNLSIFCLLYNLCIFQNCIGLYFFLHFSDSSAEDRIHLPCSKKMLSLVCVQVKSQW